MQRLLLSLCLCVSVVHYSYISPARAKPSRVISLNLCTDQLVLLLAERTRIASVTWIARDAAISLMAEAAERVPVNYGRAEEVLRAKPDLVLAGRYTQAPTLAALRRFGLAVTLFDLPATLDDVRRQIVEAAAALGEEPRGQALIDALDHRLAAVAAAAPAQRPVAALYAAGGRTAGAGTLAHEVLTGAGYDNLADRLGIASYAALPLERLVLARPDRLVAERAYEPLQARTTALAEHPALRHIAARTDLPVKLLICPGPGIAEAAERLADARR